MSERRRENTWLIAVLWCFILIRSLSSIEVHSGCGDLSNLLLNVDETAKIGYVLAQVKSVFSISITDKNSPVEYDQLPNKMWEIRLKKVLDLEKTGIKDYTVKGSCESESRQKIPFSLTLLVNEVNEYAPKFNTSSVSISVPESTGINSTVFEMKNSNPATDEDYRTNKLIVYRIEKGDLEFWAMSDSLKGIILLKKKLDFESRKVFQLIISAEEHYTKESKRANSTLIINVTDADDENPAFNNSLYNLQIPEGVYKHKCFITTPPVFAYDRDRDLDATILYDLAEGIKDVSNLMTCYNPPEKNAFGSLFSVNTKTGALCVDKKIEKGSYLIDIKAMQENNPHFRVALSIINLTVTDVNDHIPIMSKAKYNASISENAAVDTIILVLSASDEDEGKNAHFEFILEGKGSTNFEVETNLNQGLLKVAKQLDREVKEIYNFQIYAKETNTGEKHASKKSNVVVLVLDENDNSPSFNAVGPQSILENSTKGFNLTKVEATDKDKGGAGQIVYSLVPTSSSKKFVMNPETGVITLDCSNCLDYANTKNFILIVKAQDKGKPPRSSLMTIPVTVVETKFEAPRFTQSLYTLRVPENKNQSFLMKLQASDPDTSESDLVYSLTDSDIHNISNLIKVDKTGRVISLVPFDAEKKSNITFHVAVSDGHNFVQSTVEILITDVNEYDPKISIPKNTSILENSPVGTTVAHINLIDKDESNEGFKVWLEGSEGTFYFNPITNDIITAVHLDRKIKSFYTMTVHASDYGHPQRSSRMEFTVIITDSNTAPFFVNANGTVSKYRFSVKENVAVGDVIGRVHANDTDTGSSGEVHYHIKSDDFTIDENSGELKVLKSPNFEKKKSYALKVTATDNSVESKSAVITVEIDVSDVPENPVWPLQTLKVHITQSAVCESNPQSKNSVEDVTKLIAKSDEKIEYYLNNMTETFSLDKTSGLLTKKEKLKPGSYTLTIMACRSGKMSCSNVSLTVTVKSDSLLAFCHGFYIINVTETITVNSKILTVTVNKQSDDISYSIIKGNEDGKFDIDDKTGVLRTVQLLDRETTNRYIIILSAKAPSENATSQVVIDVMDEPDSPPQFSSSLYTSEVTENFKSTSEPVLHVSASDPDENSKISYKIDVNTDNSNGSFVIDEMGNIYVDKDIDYEGMNPDLKHTFTFLVLASDGVFTSNATVEIHIQDENDQTPVFSPMPQNVSIPENVKLPYNLIQVNASDLDSNDPITFSMELIKPKETENPFSINPITGQIGLRAVLDREKVSSYSLELTAKDSGNHVTVTHLLVLITDVNDNSPKFSQTTYEMNVMEGSGGVGSNVTLQVVDADEGQNSKFECHIISGNENNTFQCSANGSKVVVKTVKEIHWNRNHHQFNLTVKVTDEGSPPKSGACNVKVTVKDINDHMPHFSSEYFNAKVREDAENNTTLVLTPEFIVTDEDSDTFGRKSIVFSIPQSENTPFAIDKTTGTIFIQYLPSSPSLDRERNSSYDITILATDNDGQGLNSSASVQIDIEDVDDTAPFFSRDEYTFNVSVNYRPGTSFGKVEANDTDASTQQIFFGIKNKETPFLIDPMTGELLATRKLNTSHPRWCLNVFASDGINNKTFVKIFVNVEKAGHSCDFENSKLFSFNVSENQVDPLVIGNLTVVGVNSTYIIDNSEWKEVFRVCSSGAVTLLKPLKTSAPSIFFDVHVEGSPLCSFHINITVQRSNDYDPEICYQLNCEVKVIEFSLALNDPEETVLGQIDIRDNDTGIDGKINVILDPAAVNKLFSIDDQGILKLTKKIDSPQMEKDDGTISFALVATDEGHPPRSTNTTVHVTILKSSADQPRFTKNLYLLNVEEELEQKVPFLVGRVSVLPQFDIKYSLWPGIESNKPFEINPKTGEISTTTKLDRENQSLYEFLVVATKKITTSKMSAVALVKVMVKDINDNEPKFLNNNPTIKIKENEVGEDIFEVKATDADEGANALLTYSFVGQYYHFIINSTNGEVSLTRAFDRETTLGLKLVIKASDEGSPVRSSTTTLTVIVEDVNESPVFSSNTFFKVIKESYSTHDPIIQVTASDKDEGENGVVVYMLQEYGKPYFIISPSTGNIYCVKPSLKNGTYNLTVIAKDLGNPAQQSKADVIITVSSDYSSPAPFLTVTPSEIDLLVGMTKGMDINVTIVTNNAKSMNLSDTCDAFKLIDRRIVLNKTLLKKRQCELKFTAKSPNDATVTKVLRVQVLFLQFDQPVYIAKVAENQKIGYKIIDLDSNAEKEFNVQVKYSLLTPSDYVEINPTNGMVTLKKPFDREKVKFVTLNVSMELQQETVVNRKRRATDSATTSAKATVTIYVLDENEFPPTFPFHGSTIVISVPNNVTAGYRITDLKAYDADDSDNKDIKYKLLSGNSSGISIDTVTGVLTVVDPRALNLALVTNGYLELIVQACDVQMKPRCYNATVEIKVSDEFHLIAPISLSVFREHQDSIMRDLSSVLEYKLKILRKDVHLESGSLDTSRTDIFFQAYDEKSNIVSTKNLTSKVKQKQKQIDDIFKQFMKPAKTTVEEFSQTAIIALVSVACAIFLACFIAIIIVCRLWKKQKEEQKKNQSAQKARQNADERNGGVKNVSDPDEPLELDIDLDDSSLFEQNMLSKQSGDMKNGGINTPTKQLEDQETTFVNLQDIATETRTDDSLDKENENTKEKDKSSQNHIDVSSENGTVDDKDELVDQNNMQGKENATVKADTLSPEEDKHQHSSNGTIFNPVKAENRKQGKGSYIQSNLSLNLATQKNEVDLEDPLYSAVTKSHSNLTESTTDIDSGNTFQEDETITYL